MVTTPDFNPNVGQDAVNALVSAAESGQITYEPGTAEAMVKVYDAAVDELQVQRRTASQLTQLAGFGGFKSAQELQRGFELKMLDTVAYIDALLQSYYNLQYGLLIAGRAYPDTDDATRSRLAQAAEQKQQSANGQTSLLAQDLQAVQAKTTEVRS